MKEKARIMDAQAMGRAVQRIGYEIVERNKGTENVVRSGSPATSSGWRG